MVVDDTAPGIPVQPTMYGIFLEDINFAADGGLYAEKIVNRSFEYDNPLQGWKTFGKVEVLDEGGPFEKNPHYTAIVARVLDAAVTSFVYKLIHKGKLKTASYYITGAIMPLLNTVFFMGSLCLFYFNTDYVKGLAANYNATTPLAFVIGMVEPAVCR